MFGWYKKAEEVYEETKEQEAPKPEPEPAPAPEPEPEPINHGGDGLYKPESGLWLLKRGIRAEHVADAYAVDAQGTRRTNLSWSRNTVRDGNGRLINAYRKVNSVRPDYSASDLYHNHRLKLREAKVQSGWTLIASDANGQTLARKQIIDGNVRQE